MAAGVSLAVPVIGFLSPSYVVFMTSSTHLNRSSDEALAIGDKDSSLRVTCPARMVSSSAQASLNQSSSAA